MTTTAHAISPLRQRMIDEMTLRKLSPKTQTAYLRAVEKLTRFVGRSPDTASAEDLRRFQLHMVEDGTSSVTANATITGLRFFFDVTLDRAEAMKNMSHVYQPRKIPEVLNVDEVAHLL
ncbi:site-specific integrase [Congregibacter litoralis]|uniref:Site-specific recombinase XerD n=1 Tax=Congregibacter litoralis KT71 TaxID=314285 RepID=A4AE94_9GAMM|nr:site-specific integrase [Congregibacter litoralis]EAQ95681.2 Site-specific recombinase XerD [Congregibacter litoralis KT71]